MQTPSTLNPPPFEAILQRARWAPSGDNTQPWRFEIAGGDPSGAGQGADGSRLTIHGRDTRSDCVYDLRGHASLIAIGALLETIAIAASEHRFRVRFVRRTEAAEDQPTLDAYFDHDPALTPDPLAAFIEKRVTQRRPMKKQPLTPAQLDALSASLPPGHQIVFLHTRRDRSRIARLLFKSAHIRLTTREAFETHRKVIEWDATTSEDRIPDKAVGVDAMTRRLMRWAMQSWSRVQFLNRFMAGTILPRMQLDYLPGLRCAGHFFLIAERAPAGPDDFIAAGRALQRYWLTATQQGLLVQPQMTPLIFTQYVRSGLRFTQSQPAMTRAARIADELEAILGRAVCERTLFMGRVGFGATPASRSIRLPVEKLMQTSGDA